MRAPLTLSAVSALVAVLMLPACGSGFDAKSAAEGARVTEAPASSAPSAKPAARAACAPGEPCAEPFAIAEVAFEVDPFEKRPAATLPFDTKLEIAQQYGSVGQGPEAKSLALHYLVVSYAGDIEGFERDAAAPLRGAVKLPPATWLAFERQANLRTRAVGYRSVIVRTPLIVTSSDVASARAATRENTTIDMNRPGVKEAPTSVVEVTLTEGGAAKIAAWGAKNPEAPLAVMVAGRVVDEGRFVGRSKELALPLAWLAPEATKGAAEKLAREIQGRGAGK